MDFFKGHLTIDTGNTGRVTFRCNLLQLLQYGKLSQSQVIQKFTH